ncbi:hypothetical protein OFEAOIEE_LOCUS4996 [Methylorubrum extorquens]
MDRHLGLGVECRGRLVEEQDRRLFEESASDADPLALPAREPRAALADDGVVAFWQVAHETVASGGAGHREHRRVVRFGSCEADIVHHGAVQQPDLLRHHRERVAQRILPHAGDWLFVDADLAAIDVVEALEQVHERRFARPRRSDDADLLAGRDRQRDAVERRVPRPVAEGDVAQFDLPAPRYEGGCAG